jgi:hypothetical protein
LPGDGWYWIKLISEDMDGNRSEAAYSITVDTTDGDADGVPDVLDNCPTMEHPNQSDQDDDGIGDVCDVEPYFFWPTTTNQGVDGESITMEDGMTFTEEDQSILWTTRDSDAPDDDLGWASRKGIEYSYVSYREVGLPDWSDETETQWLSGPVGFIGMWSWVNPVDYIAADGVYEIKLVSEDIDGFLCEEVYTIEVAVP